ncbi:hypothetical protein Q8A67_007982 [Cirrhinus molitorella]|uniref:Uncharacterized protein n=1 Tax=Cirrhinus molitorella TaxID=172907 RepID=A0AA88PTJ0_9TELE|nr:hypothetical protein Q8A67_007982 [Cirrhinus molitorella]
MANFTQKGVAWERLTEVRSEGQEVRDHQQLDNTQEERRFQAEKTVGRGAGPGSFLSGRSEGPIMMSKGIQGSNEASKAIRAAEEEKQKCKERVNYYYANQLEYQSKIFWTQFEIQQTNNALNRIEVEIKKVQKNLEDTADIQGKVREAVNSLSVFSGRVTAVEKQTQRFILWKPVVKAMEDVVKAVVNIAENRLLYSDGAPSFINALRENVGRLALCNSPDNFEYGCSLSQYEYY